MRAGVYEPLLEVSTNRDSRAPSLMRPRRTGQGSVGGRSRTRCEIEIQVGRGEEVLAGDGGGILAGEARAGPCKLRASILRPRRAPATGWAPRSSPGRHLPSALPDVSPGV